MILFSGDQTAQTPRDDLIHQEVQARWYNRGNQTSTQNISIDRHHVKHLHSSSRPRRGSTSSQWQLLARREARLDIARRGMDGR